MAGTGREEQGKVVGEEWEGRTGVRSGKCFQTHDSDLETIPRDKIRMAVKTMIEEAQLELTPE